MVYSSLDRQADLTADLNGLARGQWGKSTHARVSELIADALVEHDKDSLVVAKDGLEAVKKSRSRPDPVEDIAYIHALLYVVDRGLKKLEPEEAERRILEHLTTITFGASIDDLARRLLLPVIEADTAIERLEFRRCVEMRHELGERLYYIQGHGIERLAELNAIRNPASA